MANGTENGVDGSFPNPISQDASVDGCSTAREGRVQPTAVRSYTSLSQKRCCDQLGPTMLTTRASL